MPSSRVSRLSSRVRGRPPVVSIALSVLLGATVNLPPAAHAAGTDAAAVAQPYQLPAGKLGSTLSAFAANTGVRLSFDPALTEGMTHGPLTGHGAPRDVLSRLLADTGLMLVSRPDGSYTLREQPRSTGAATLPTITVTGTAAREATSPYQPLNASTGTKTDTPLMETPQSISVVTREQMTVQGVQTVSEGLAYTAGVHTNVAGDNPADNTLMVRGFQQITANAYTDGLRNNQVGYYAPEPFGMERIEVLKGPASVLYGQGSPGGTINLASKTPRFASHREVGISTGTNDRRQATLDIGGVLDARKTLAYRLVALGRNANSTIDGIKDDRLYLAPSITWAPSADTSFTVLASYQKNRNLFTSNLPYSMLDGSNPNGRVSRHQSLNEPGFDTEKAEQTSLGYALSHRLNDTWTVQQNARYSHFSGYENQLFRNSGVINGDTIARYYQLRNYRSNNVAVDNRLIGRLATGPLHHTLLMGVDYQHGARTATTQTGNAPSINVYHPTRIPIDTTQATSQASTADRSRQLGIYLQDQIAMNQWVATLAGRYDWASSNTRNRLTDTRQDTDARDFSGRAALGYAFDAGFFPYVSYSESFTPLSGSDITGTAFKPESARQVELGIKYQAPGSPNTITLAAFDLRRQNVLTPNPQNTSFSVQQGEVAARGVELESVLRPVTGLNLLAAYSYNDLEVTKDNPNAAGISTRGKVPVRAPRHLVSLWADYTWQGGMLEGLTLGGGARYTGSSYGDAQNTFKVPGYTLIDAMMAYDFGRTRPALKGLKAAINVRNLTDKYYVAGCFLNTACLLGAGRSVIVNATYQW